MNASEVPFSPKDRFLMRRDPATGIEAVHARFHGHAYDMHMHDNEWLVGVTHDGLQDFFCRGRRQQSTAGRVILIEPGERHDGQSLDPQGFTYSMLYLPIGWVREELGGDAAIGFRDSLARDPLLAQTLAATCLSILDQAPGLAIENQRDAAMDRLRSHLGAGVRAEERPDDSVAVRAMDYLRAHCCKDVSNAILVKETGAVSRYQLTRSFKARYGTSPHASLVQLRLARARAMLKAGVPPAEAAASCGFADQSHMTRWFRRAYGLPPGAYMRGRTNVQDEA